MRAHDAGGVLRQLWRDRGLAPSAAARTLTPFDLLFLFYAADAPRADPQADPVRALREANERRAAAGLKPHVPPWWLTRPERKPPCKTPSKRPPGGSSTPRP